MSDLHYPTLTNFALFIENKYPESIKFVALINNCNNNHHKKLLDIDNAFTYIEHLRKYHKWNTAETKKDLKLVENLIHAFLHAEVEDLAKIEDIKAEANLTIEFQEFDNKKIKMDLQPDALRYAEIRDKIVRGQDKYQQYVIIKDYFLEKYIVHSHPITNEIFIYQDSEGIFKADGEIFLKQEIQNIMPFWTRDARNEILDKVRIDTYFKNGNPFNKQNIIVCENGVIKLDDLFEKKEKYFHEFSADFLSTKKIPIFYKKDIILESSNIMNFLNWATCNDELFTNYLLEAIADCFNNHYKSQIIHLFVGEGQNGKGTFLRLLSDFLGGPTSGNITALGFGQIYENSFKLHGLEFAMANINGDSSATFIRDPGTIKKASGEDIINADVKNEKKQRPFYNTAKMFSSSQHVPEAKDEDTEGWYRRFKISDWRATLTDDMKAQSLEFEKNLRLPDELSYLLNKVLESYINLANRNFVFNFSSKTPEEKRIDYLKKSSPIKLFIENVISFDNSTGKLFKDTLVNAFNIYNEKILLNRRMDKVTFWKKIKYEFEEIPVRQEKGKRYYEGLELQTNKLNDILKEHNLDQYVNAFDSIENDSFINFQKNVEGYPFIDSVIYSVIQKYESDDLCYADIVLKLFYFKNEIVRESLDRLSKEGKIYEPWPNLFRISN